MYNNNEYDDTGRGNFDNNNYRDDNFNYEGNEGNFNYDNNQFGLEQNYDQGMGIQNNGTNNGNDSLHLDKYIDKIENNPNIQQKEAEYSQKIEDLIKSKGVKVPSNWSKVVFFMNKVLLGVTLFEGLLDRFDAVGLTLSFIVFFIEIGFFSENHYFIWVLSFVGSIAIDVLIFLDILFVSF